MKKAWGKGFFLAIAVVGSALLHLAAVQAHGVTMEYTIDTTVTVQAIFDTGEPMAEGQVLVYGPADPREPVLTGTTDEEGYFTFTPDAAMPGTWTVQTRQAGHGASIDVELGSDGSLGGSGGGLSVPQTILMGASVIWGLVGTALFFYRGRDSTSTKMLEAKE